MVKGLVINGFDGNGVFVSGTTTSNRIEGNFIGIDPSGTLNRGNELYGVIFVGRGVSQGVVGGTTPAARNLISGNVEGGLFMGGGFSGAPANSMRVQGNYIGTDRSGKEDLGNEGVGLDIEDATGTTVGGTTAATRNVISGNSSVGVHLISGSGSRVVGNRIGTTASGTTALGNGLGGVLIEGGSSDNQIGDGTTAGSNTVAFNGHDGVAVIGSVLGSTSTGNEVSRNSIFSNGGLGIDLMGLGEDFFTDIANKNDAGDADSGPNNLQNKPVLTSAKAVSGTTTIKGKLDSTPGKSFVVRFFSNPSGTDEGKKFIGQKSVNTGSDGNTGTFTFSPASKVAAGQTITATATKSATGDTSGFSTPRTVASS